MSGVWGWWGELVRLVMVVAPAGRSAPRVLWASVNRRRGTVGKRVRGHPPGEFDAWRTRARSGRPQLPDGRQPAGLRMI